MLPLYLDTKLLSRRTAHRLFHSNAGALSITKLPRRPPELRVRVSMAGRAGYTATQ